MPEADYVAALLEDLADDIARDGKRDISTIFFGGGTPSLFSPKAIGDILDGVGEQLHLANDIEITMEANPGTVEQKRFEGFRAAGINRLSLGIQSLQDDKLKALGRIHSAKEAITAINAAKNAGFDDFNCDLMFGLPNQTLDDALFDLQSIIDLKPTHISWYQLTLEPNTLFHAKPPVLPMDDNIWDMQQAGQALLAKHGYAQYEVSAYAQRNKQCQHNLNYWRFGNYYGIGAGAHGKLEHTRMWKQKQPKAYLAKPYLGEVKPIEKNELVFEFMLNALRLNENISFDLFESATGLDRKAITAQLAELSDLIACSDDSFKKTELGARFLNDVVEKFL